MIRCRSQVVQGSYGYILVRVANKQKRNKDKGICAPQEAPSCHHSTSMHWWRPATGDEDADCHQYATEKLHGDHPFNFPASPESEPPPSCHPKYRVGETRGPQQAYRKNKPSGSHVRTWPFCSKLHQPKDSDRYHFNTVGDGVPHHTLCLLSRKDIMIVSRYMTILPGWVVTDPPVTMSKGTEEHVTIPQN